jgi:hypothetical protein
VHIQLAERLFEKKLYRAEMEIVAKYQTATLGNVNTVETIGTYMIESVGRRSSDNSLVFSAVSVDDGHKKAFVPESVVSIDGMTPERFAAVYGIAPDGGLRRVGVRRGRKPKIRE